MIRLQFRDQHGSRWHHEYESEQSARDAVTRMLANHATLLAGCAIALVTDVGIEVLHAPWWARESASDLNRWFGGKRT